MSDIVPQPQSSFVIVSPTGDMELSHASLEDAEILENPTDFLVAQEEDETFTAQLRSKSNKQLAKTKDFVKSLYATKKRRFIVKIALCLIGVVAIIATLTETLKAHERATNSSAQSSSGIGISMLQPHGDAAKSIGESSTDPSDAQVSGSQTALFDGSSSTNASTVVPPPGPPGSCRLDTEMDKNLLYLTCPYVSNANGGFAMDKPCLSGERCVYACEPPYVNTENGFSDTDCVPYLGRCDPYSASTYNGGLQCEDGVIKKQFPEKALCAMGLNTSFIKSYVPEVISSCQTVYPGNEAPMIGIEVEAGQSKQLTSFPQWYWHSTHARFYVSVQKKKRHEACQWNYDALSLNSGGVDWMPYVVGGGSLAGHTCSECGQHNLDFSENFDFEKVYSSLPGFGIRVRNCNDFGCGDIQCDATYRYNPARKELEMYWAVYNTIYSLDTVGCVAESVQGNSWSGKPKEMNKYTLFEYYPIDTSTGKQDADCKDCSAPSFFDASRCRMLRQRRRARFGTGINPAMYVCTPSGGAIALENKLIFAQLTNQPVEKTPPNVVVVQVIALIALCIVVTLMVVVTVRYVRRTNEYITRNGVDSKEEQPAQDAWDPDSIDSIGTPPKQRDSCSHCSNCSSRSSGSYASLSTRAGSITDTRASTSRLSSIGRIQELFNRIHQGEAGNEQQGNEQQDSNQGEQNQSGFQEPFSIEELRVTPVRRPSQMEACEIQFVIDED